MVKNVKMLVADKATIDAKSLQCGADMVTKLGRLQASLDGETRRA